ncbi:DUF5361 domain-containing protein [Streptococcus uberis]|uniref:DUF5361 domain-containing protein n=1 Tax=Streptococcus uberis TaxID=1349 RepID=UPI001FF1050B|nr:DUF5361 domain-containing protein [Streptococcus uberis]MCK1227503.1 DUF5361 domain-containing protein [Streptococcus uberis]
MIKVDEDALICDLAETYHIYDYRQLPASLVAVFSVGLRENSRIKMKLSGQNIDLNNFLLAGVYDRLSLLVWMKTEDGQKNKNRPNLITSLLSGEVEKSDGVAFDSSEDFEKARIRLLNKLEVI